MEAAMNELLLCMEAIKPRALDSCDLATEILITTANVLHIEEEEIRSLSRSREISDARKIAIYLMVDHTVLPYRLIGELVGDRDHSTVNYNYYGAEDLMRDKRFLRKFAAVKKQLGL